MCGACCPQAGKDTTELAKASTLSLGHPKELELALHICKFSEAVEDMLDELVPNKWVAQFDWNHCAW